MPLVKPFALDRWITEQRPKCNTFLQDSCIAPLTLTELRALSTDGQEQTAADPIDDAHVLSYGTIKGSARLRAAIAATFAPDAGITADDVIVTAGAISANFLILDTLCGPGDHVICTYPTYSQLFELARRSGAEISLWRQREQHGWSLDVDELKALVKPNTSMIIVNNPSNPTGAVIPRETLEAVVAVAAGRDILVFSDEVFRPLFHDESAPVPPSLLDLKHPNSIVTGSMSKSYALPGIRVGWIAAHPSLRANKLHRLIEARDYTTISVSQLDDQVAAYALQPAVRARILARSAAIARRNVAILDAWARKHPERVRVVIPKGAGTCIVTILGRDGQPVDDAAFAEALAEEEGVLAPPAHLCFGSEGVSDLKGGLRVGVVMREGVLEAGLAGIERLMGKWGAS